MPPKPIVLCGPSGVGKSTLLRKLMNEYESCFGFSVSHTTRDPRPGEEDGVHYHFVTREQMSRSIKNGEFLEHAEYSGNLYGTSRKAVENVMSSNRMCVLDIDTQGVKQVKESGLNPRYIFVMPPSIESLEERLRFRGTETEASLSKRLNMVKKEIEYGLEAGNFDLVVVNDDVDKAYEQMKEFLASEIRELLLNS